MVNTFTIGNSLKYIQYLDNKRLGKQRVEAKQIITILEYFDQHGTFPETGGWKNHPATLMWLGHTKSLKLYFNAVVKEWVRRGYENSYEYYNVEECTIISCKFDGHKAEFDGDAGINTFPLWFSFPPFYLAQRAALIRKSPRDYSRFLDDETKQYLTYGYLWPSKIPPEAYSAWKMDYLAAVSVGAPSHYRISKEEAREWRKNPNINPQTKRRIQIGGPKYQDYEKAAEHYDI